MYEVVITTGAVRRVCSRFAAVCCQQRTKHVHQYDLRWKNGKIKILFGCFGRICTGHLSEKCRRYYRGAGNNARGRMLGSRSQ